MNMNQKGRTMASYARKRPTSVKDIAHPVSNRSWMKERWPLPLANCTIYDGIRLDLWVLGAGKRTIRLGEQRRVRDTARSHEVDGVHNSKTAASQICADSLSVARTSNVETLTDD